MSTRSVMKRAGQLRRQGYDASSALSEAWAESGGGYSNPISAEEGGGGLLLVAIAGIVGWRLWKKVWPWQSIALARRTVQPHPAIGVTQEVPFTDGRRGSEPVQFIMPT